MHSRHLLSHIYLPQLTLAYLATDDFDASRSLVDEEMRMKEVLGLGAADRDMTWWTIFHSLPPPFVEATNAVISTVY